MKKTGDTTVWLSTIDIRIISQNARGLGDSKKRCKVLSYFGAKADILFLQETHTKRQDEGTGWGSTWRGEVIMSHGTNRSAGTAICMSNK